MAKRMTIARQSPLARNHMDRQFSPWPPVGYFLSPGFPIMTRIPGILYILVFQQDWHKGRPFLKPTILPNNCLGNTEIFVKFHNAPRELVMGVVHLGPKLTWLARLLSFASLFQANISVDDAICKLPAGYVGPCKAEKLRWTFNVSFLIMRI